MTAELSAADQPAAEPGNDRGTSLPHSLSRSPSDVASELSDLALAGPPLAGGSTGSALPHGPNTRLAAPTSRMAGKPGQPAANKPHHVRHKSDGTALTGRGGQHPVFSGAGHERKGSMDLGFRPAGHERKGSVDLGSRPVGLPHTLTSGAAHERKGSMDLGARPAGLPNILTSAKSSGRGLAALSRQSSDTSEASAAIGSQPLTARSRAAGAAQKDGKDVPVMVVCAIRPLIQMELEQGCKEVVRAVPSQPGKVQVLNRFYDFDKAFGAEGQDLSELYAETAQPLVDGLFEGYNSTVFAYGQTGSGKTYTMGTGAPGVKDEDLASGAASASTWEHAIVTQVMAGVFQHVQAIRAQGKGAVQVSCAFCEVYMNDVYDLQPSGIGRTSADRPNKRAITTIEALKHTDVDTVEQLRDQMAICIKERATGATKMNKESSRSHAIFTIRVEQRRKVNALTADFTASSGPAAPDDNDEVLTGRINLADLAGAERLDRSGAVGTQVKEASSINMGLMVLGRVIAALASTATQRPHVPYNDHPLTRLLRDAIGGNSRTVMIACISPADSNLSETINTLDYATDARKVKNVPVRNANKIKLLQEENEALRRQLEELAEKLVAAEERFTGCVALEDFAKQKEELEGERLRASLAEADCESLEEKLNAALEDLDEIRSLQEAAAAALQDQRSSPLGASPLLDDEAAAGDLMVVESGNAPTGTAAAAMGPADDATAAEHAEAGAAGLSMAPSSPETLRQAEECQDQGSPAQAAAQNADATNDSSSRPCQPRPTHALLAGGPLVSPGKHCRSPSANDAACLSPSKLRPELSRSWSHDEGSGMASPTRLNSSGGRQALAGEGSGCWSDHLADGGALESPGSGRKSARNTLTMSAPRMGSIHRMLSRSTRGSLTPAVNLSGSHRRLTHDHLVLPIVLDDALVQGVKLEHEQHLLSRKRRDAQEVEAALQHLPGSILSSQPGQTLNSGRQGGAIQAAILRLTQGPQLERILEGEIAQRADLGKQLAAVDRQLLALDGSPGKEADREALERRRAELAARVQQHSTKIEALQVKKMELRDLRVDSVVHELGPGAGPELLQSVLANAVDQRLEALQYQAELVDKEDALVYKDKLLMVLNSELSQKLQEVERLRAELALVSETRSTVEAQLAQAAEEKVEVVKKLGEAEDRVFALRQQLVEQSAKAKELTAQLLGPARVGFAGTPTRKSRLMMSPGPSQLHMAPRSSSESSGSPGTPGAATLVSSPSARDPLFSPEELSDAVADKMAWVEKASGLSTEKWKLEGKVKELQAKVNRVEAERDHLQAQASLCSTPRASIDASHLRGSEAGETAASGLTTPRRGSMSFLSSPFALLGLSERLSNPTFATAASAERSKASDSPSAASSRRVSTSGALQATDLHLLGSPLPANAAKLASSSRPKSGSFLLRLSSLLPSGSGDEPPDVEQHPSPAAAGCADVATAHAESSQHPASTTSEAVAETDQEQGHAADATLHSPSSSAATPAASDWNRSASGVPYPESSQGTADDSVIVAHLPAGQLRISGPEDCLQHGRPDVLAPAVLGSSSTQPQPPTSAAAASAAADTSRIQAHHAASMRKKAPTGLWPVPAATAASLGQAPQQRGSRTGHSSPGPPDGAPDADDVFIAEEDLLEDEQSHSLYLHKLARKVLAGSAPASCDTAVDSSAAASHVTATDSSRHMDAGHVSDTQQDEYEAAHMAVAAAAGEAVSAAVEGGGSLPAGHAARSRHHASPAVPPEVAALAQHMQDRLQLAETASSSHDVAPSPKAGPSALTPRFQIDLAGKFRTSISDDAPGAVPAAALRAIPAEDAADAVHTDCSAPHDALAGPQPLQGHAASSGTLASTSESAAEQPGKSSTEEMLNTEADAQQSSSGGARPETAGPVLTGPVSASPPATLNVCFAAGQDEAPIGQALSETAKHVLVDAAPTPPPAPASLQAGAADNPHGAPVGQQADAAACGQPACRDPACDQPAGQEPVHESPAADMQPSTADVPHSAAQQHQVAPFSTAAALLAVAQQTSAAEAATASAGDQHQHPGDLQPCVDAQRRISGRSASTSGGSDQEESGSEQITEERKKRRPARQRSVHFRDSGEGDTGADGRTGPSSPPADLPFSTTRAAAAGPLGGPCSGRPGSAFGAALDAAAQQIRRTCSLAGIPGPILVRPGPGPDPTAPYGLYDPVLDLMQPDGSSRGTKCSLQDWLAKLGIGQDWRQCVHIVGAQLLLADWLQRHAVKSGACWFCCKDAPGEADSTCHPEFAEFAMCEACASELNANAPFSSWGDSDWLDEDGLDEYCRICAGFAAGHTEKLFICDVDGCGNAFCGGCLWRFTADDLSKLKDTHWQCPCCRPGYLLEPRLFEAAGPAIGRSREADGMISPETSQGHPLGGEPSSEGAVSNESMQRAQPFSDPSRPSSRASIASSTGDRGSSVQPRGAGATAGAAPARSRSSRSSNEDAGQPQDAPRRQRGGSTASVGYMTSMTARKKVAQAAVDDSSDEDFIKPAPRRFLKKPAANSGALPVKQQKRRSEAGGASMTSAAAPGKIKAIKPKRKLLPTHSVDSMPGSPVARPADARASMPSWTPRMASALQKGQTGSEAGLAKGSGPVLSRTSSAASTNSSLANR